MGLTEEMYLESVRRKKEGDQLRLTPSEVLGSLKALDDHIEDLRKRVKEMEEVAFNGHNGEEGETPQGGGSHRRHSG